MCVCGYTVCVCVCVCGCVKQMPFCWSQSTSIRLQPKSSRGPPGTSRPLLSPLPPQVRRRPNGFVSSRRSTDAWRGTSARQKFTSCHRSDIDSRFVLVQPRSVIDSVECWRICCAVEFSCVSTSFHVISSDSDDNTGLTFGLRCECVGANVLCMRNIWHNVCAIHLCIYLIIYDSSFDFFWYFLFFLGKIN